MAFTTKSSITTTIEFLVDLVAYAVANAGFADEGSISITDSGGNSQTMYRISKTVDTVKMYYYFHYSVDPEASHSDTAYRMKMMKVLPTDANKELTSVDGQYRTTNLGLYDQTPTFTGYSFFTDGQGFFATLEVSTGVFCHMAFGNITKNATFTGGAYLAANNFGRSGNWYNILSASNIYGSRLFLAQRNIAQNNAQGGSYIHYDLGGSDWRNFTLFGSETNTEDFGAGGTIPPTNQTNEIEVSSSVINFSIWDDLVRLSPSATTLRAPLFPVYIVRTPVGWSTSDELVMLGIVPNIRAINVSLLTDKELVNTDWRTFPLAYKGGTTSVATLTYEWGVAFREIT